jgi:hypothetical protein
MLQCAFLEESLLLQQVLSASRSSQGLLGGSHRSYGSCSLLSRLHRSAYGVLASGSCASSSTIARRTHMSGYITPPPVSLFSERRVWKMPSISIFSGRLRQASAAHGKMTVGTLRCVSGPRACFYWLSVPHSLVLVPSCFRVHPFLPVSCSYTDTTVLCETVVRSLHHGRGPCTAGDAAASARHQCLPFQVVECGRYQQIWRLYSLQNLWTSL